ncbi:MAG: ethanolamine ammonia-lyase light chain EutC, partial [Gemmataceae bacterium]
MLPIPADALLAAVRDRTPARLLAGRAGLSYRTATELALRADHAAARDAVLDEVAGHDLPGLLEVRTRAASKQQYLARPDLGRSLSDEGRALLRERCRPAELQVFVGDGLSAAAVRTQVPRLLALLLGAVGWDVGTPFFVRYCR